MKPFKLFLLLWSSLLVGLSGCGGNRSTQAPAIDGKGFGGTDQFVAALQAARDRLVDEAIAIEGTGADLSCRTHYTGPSQTVGDLLSVLTGDPAKRSAAEHGPGSLSSISDLKAALYRAEITAQDDLAGSEAFVIHGDKITFRTLSSGNDDDLLFLVARAAYALAGVADGEATRGAAACLSNP